MEKVRRNRKPRQFNPKWLEGRDWLNYDEGKSLMTCSVCGEYYKGPTSSVNLKGQMFLKGSTNVKISAIVDHERSVSHLKEASAFYASKRSNTEIFTTTEAGKSLQALKQNDRERLNTLFRNAHAVMKHDRPLSDYKWLCSLENWNMLFEFSRGIYLNEIIQINNSDTISVWFF